MTWTAADLDLHGRLGIDAELLQRHAMRVDDREGREVLSLNGKPGTFAGIAYHYHDPRTDHQVHARVRLDHPPVKADGMPDGKYRSAYGNRPHLFFPRGLSDLLADTTVPVIFVESERAALAILAAAVRAGRRVLVVATGGCWSWRGVRGKATAPDGTRVDEKGPVPDLDLITYTGRPVTILFDARPNDSVRAARRAFGRELRGRGADVRHGHLPDDDVRVNGPDDLIAARGEAALWAVIDGATTEEFRRRKSGAILADDLDNIRLALMQVGTVLRFDAFAQHVLLDGVPLDDVALDRLWVRLNDTCGFRPSKETLRTVLVVEAHRSTVHPVRAYLDALTWDGVPRLDTWLIDLAGAAPSDYVRAIGALPLLAAVRRIRQPGAKFDELVILESPQGTFKSSALRALCPNDAWFSDDLPLGADSKHVIERTSGRWIIEACELHGHRGREAEQLKAFLSRQVDGPVRLAYARLPVSVPRQFIMIGTTNNLTSYLKDSTGARRFWPVRVEGFDLAAVTRDRDQLWAEAACREADGTSIRLASGLWAEAGEHQEQRRAGDPWEEILEPLLDTDDDAVSVDDIWDALKLEASYRDNRAADRVAAIAQRYEFVAKRKCRRGGPPRYYWVRGRAV
ncbi:MAG: DUF3854 domain-containing protein [Gemmatimonadaceae bacterium]|nr:DUF3854 domain-containing protein [Gemmatimonadaceae bacterium]